MFGSCDLSLFPKLMTEKPLAWSEEEAGMLLRALLSGAETRDATCSSSGIVTPADLTHCRGMLSFCDQLNNCCCYFFVEVTLLKL